MPVIARWNDIGLGRISLAQHHERMRQVKGEGHDESVADAALGDADTLAVEATGNRQIRQHPHVIVDATEICGPADDRQQFTGESGQGFTDDTQTQGCLLVSASLQPRRRGDSTLRQHGHDDAATRRELNSGVHV